MTSGAGLTSTEIRDRVVLLAGVSACIALPIAMLLMRDRVNGEVPHAMVFWNLLLVVPPVVLAVAVESAWRHGRGVLGAVFFVMWVLMFPNAPYLVTDLIHLRELPPTPLWYDALIFVAAAAAGLIAAFVSLHLVQSVVARRWGEARGWVLAVAVLTLSGFGIYLGRFVRLYSWDVLDRPAKLVRDVFTAVLVDDRSRALAVTALFSAFLIISYTTVEMMTRVGRPPATADMAEADPAV